MKNEGSTGDLHPFLIYDIKGKTSNKKSYRPSAKTQVES
jgi:hypothetical protein